MTRLLAALVACALFAACGPLVAGDRPDIVTGHVTEVVKNGSRVTTATAVIAPYQSLKIQLDDSLYRGEVEDLEWAGRRALDGNGFLRVGDRVLLSVTREGNQRTYTILEVVRLPTLIPVAAVLALALLVIARLKGLAALAGLAASVVVFLVAIVPAVQRGDDPLVATLLGSLGVIAVSVFVHGIDRRSLAALCGTMAGLGVVTALGAFALATARMTGLGTENEVLLAAGTASRIDMPRLVLAGIMVGSLGAIVDLCVGQASATAGLATGDETLRGRRLYASALSAGRDHVGSVVSTIALAYFGGALPLMLLASLGQQPLAAAVNSEAIVEILIAILSASIGLVLCVPVATAIAVMFAGKARPAEA